MKILRLLVVCNLLWGLLLSEVFAQDVLISGTIDERGEAVVLVKNPGRQNTELLSGITSIDKVIGQNFVVYLNSRQYRDVQMLDLDLELYQPYYNTSRALNMASDVENMSGWDKYPTWDVYLQMMLNFATDYPEICRLDTIGFSEEGRAILVVKISDNVDTDEAEPEFFLTGQMHGDELVSYILPLRMIDYLLSGYGSDDQVDNLVNNMELWINPLSNPDGTYGDNENDVSGATRYNANGIDLNRNFPDPNGSYNPDGNETAAENIAMMDFAGERHFVMSANSHSGAEVVNYPWDTWAEVHADNDWLYEISRKYADTVHANSPSGYMTILDDGITNGYAWYTTDGSRQDYFNYYEHCREVTFEWSNDKLLSSDELPAHWNYNKNALLNYFAEAVEGIHGIVTDSLTGEPLNAEITIEGHDNRNSRVYSKLPNGDYHRVIAAGEWGLTFSAAGYKTKTLDFSLDQDERIDQDVQLVPLSSLPPFASFSVVGDYYDCNSEVQFTNTTEYAGSISFEWDFGDGTGSTEVNPVHQYTENGIYTVSLSAENENGTDVYTEESLIEIDLTQLDSVHSASNCSGAASLSLEAFGNGDIHWFSDQEMETEVYVGTPFITPVLATSTTYWAAAVNSGDSFSGGEPDNSQGGDYDSGDAEHYLLFDCIEPCILYSVIVYAETAGEKNIWLKNDAGEVLEERNVTVNAGENTILLEMDLPVANDMRLVASADAGFYKGQLSWWDTFDYPYAIEGLVSIKNSDAGEGWTSSEQIYPYFYNWNVRTPDCHTELMPVFAVIDEQPDAGFSWEMNNTEVEFENLSLYGTDFIWDFGDGSTSQEYEPTHNYTADGGYLVRLDVYNDCGHSSVTETIFVQNAGLDDQSSVPIVFYPNPADNVLNIFLPEGEGKSYTYLNIFDLSGRILVKTRLLISKNHIDISELKQGVYILRFLDEKGQGINKKLIINR